MNKMMEKNKMNEFNLIRERFLADTREHFFTAGPTIRGACDAMAVKRTPGGAGNNEMIFRPVSA
jgi:hypothetical protein